jgi:transposase InsO family protein
MAANTSLHAAFVIDTCADRIVGWRVSWSAKTDFVLRSRQICFTNRLPGNECCWSRPCMINGLFRKVG